MTTAVPTDLVWVGDPTVLVYAVRYVLEHGGASHAAGVVRQTVMDNLPQLVPAARRVIAHDIDTWVASDNNDAPPREWHAWKKVAAAVRIPSARPTIARKDLH